MQEQRNWCSIIEGIIISIEIVSDQEAAAQCFTFYRTLEKTNYKLFKLIDIPSIDLKHYPNYKIHAFVLDNPDKLSNSSTRVVKRRKTLENIFIDENFRAIEREMDSQVSVFQTERLESPEQRSPMDVKPEPESRPFQITEPKINVEEPVRSTGSVINNKTMVDATENVFKNPSFNKNLELLSHLSEEQDIAEPEIEISPDMSKKQKIMARIANARRGSIPTDAMTLAIPKPRAKTLITDNNDHRNSKVNPNLKGNTTKIRKNSKKVAKKKKNNATQGIK